MPMLDVFKNDVFGFTSLTAAILKRPFKPARCGQLGLFDERGIMTTHVAVEIKDGRLSLISTSPRGGPASTIGAKKRTAVPFIVPHLERESNLVADEVQNVRSFGSENAMDAVMQLVQERALDLRDMHEVTLEHMRIGAIKGQVVDADGSTVLEDLFTKFGVSQQTATLAPNSASDTGDQLRMQIRGIIRQIELVLGGDRLGVTGYRAFCGRDFFDELSSDLGVTQTLRWADPSRLLGQQQDGAIRFFNFGGVVWEEYPRMEGGEVASPVSFVADDEAYVFPDGKPSPIFRTAFAPADFIDTVNTIGLPMYTRVVVDEELQRWVKVHTQSNPLSICLRPDAVVKVTIST